MSEIHKQLNIPATKTTTHTTKASTALPKKKKHTYNLLKKFSESPPLPPPRLFNYAREKTRTRRSLTLTYSAKFARSCSAGARDRQRRRLVTFQLNKLQFEASLLGRRVARLIIQAPRRTSRTRRAYGWGFERKEREREREWPWCIGGMRLVGLSLTGVALGFWRVMAMCGCCVCVYSCGAWNDRDRVRGI